MKKKFRLIIDLTVRIKEDVKVKDREKKQHLEALLAEFLKDNEALLEFYKPWLLGDLQSDEYVDELQKDLKVRDEKDIIKALVKRLPDQDRQYFDEIFGRIDNSWFEELEDFFSRLSLLKFVKGSFAELKE